MKRLLIWLLEKMGYRPTMIPQRVHDIADALLPIVRQLEEAPQGGEWKRHQAYARGIKAFPDAHKTDIALAIELAVRQMKGFY